MNKLRDRPLIHPDSGSGSPVALYSSGMVSKGRGGSISAEEGKTVSRQRVGNEPLASPPSGGITRSFGRLGPFLRELEK